jgi:ArsR family transcriptional regulator, lead/cadmium/zinc/bismuth-responsive transcriptional repressor
VRETISGQDEQQNWMQGREQMEQVAPEKVDSDHSIHPEQMRAVRENMLPYDIAQDVSSFFAILKDPTRLQVVYALLHAPAKELCVSDIAAGLGRDDTTISHQLRLLKSQRIVAMRKEGRVVYYHLIDDHVRIVLELALSHIHETPKLPRTMP